MKKLLLLLVVFIASCMPVEDAGKSLHVFSSVKDDTGNACSAVSVGPHTIITAAHCFNGISEYHIGDTTVKIDKIVDDGNDHVLLSFSNITFKNFIAFRPVNTFQKEKVYCFGNPLALDLKNQYREGYVSGFAVLPQISRDTTIVFVFSSMLGDSGSLIFNKHGKVVGMLSYASSGFVVSLPFKFTKQQLAEIK